EEEKHMFRSERLEILVLGSGVGGKLIAWHMAQSGRRTAVVERRWVGGSCPNIACNCQLARACHNVRRRSAIRVERDHVVARQHGRAVLFIAAVARGPGK